MHTYLVAVSGGVDSVVLLDMLARGEGRLVVAHVDHGIREDSAADARFVEALAKRYGLPFVSTRLALGPDASEQQARTQRYEFLYTQARQFHAEIVTAHHQDDLVETVAINLERGTGWRGLAVLARVGISRPLLGMTKQQLTAYALTHRLEWVEDSTNRNPKYQRNRIRGRRTLHADRLTAEAIAKLRARQLQLRRDISRETDRLLARHAGSRHFLTQIDATVARELLGSEMAAAVGIRPTRPQLTRALQAVATARAGTTHDVGDGVKLTFTTRKYSIDRV